mmetsp:Transcript_141600/g.353036  ORF Transcript_141600/g.353036 Transcript_141600/m.353036 type:complete len:220 (-) Transcript_141600:105-764(-)
MADRKTILESLVAALTIPLSDEEDSGQEDAQDWTQTGWATTDMCWVSAVKFQQAYLKMASSPSTTNQKQGEPLSAGPDLDEAAVRKQLSQFENSITSVSFQPGHGFVVVGIDGEYTLIQSWAELWTMAWWLGDEGPEAAEVDTFPGKQDVLKPMLKMRDTFSKKFYPFDVFWDEVFKQLPEVSKLKMEDYEDAMSGYGEPGFHCILTMNTVPFHTSGFQ